MPAPPKPFFTSPNIVIENEKEIPSETSDAGKMIFYLSVAAFVGTIIYFVSKSIKPSK